MMTLILILTCTDHEFAAIYSAFNTFLAGPQKAELVFAAGCMVFATFLRLILKLIFDRAHEMLPGTAFWQFFCGPLCSRPVFCQIAKINIQTQVAYFLRL